MEKGCERQVVGEVSEVAGRKGREVSVGAEEVTVGDEWLKAVKVRL